MTRRLPLLSPRARKAWLLAHVVLSVGWLGAGAANAVLAVYSLLAPTSRALSPLRAHAAIHLIDTWVVIPAAFGSLATGIVVSVFTRWGLFVHWWVMAKLALTVGVIAVSTVGIGRWIEMSLAAGTDAGAHDVASAITTAAIGNLAAFVTMTALSIYKPRGTRPHAIDLSHPWGLAEVAFSGMILCEVRMAAPRGPMSSIPERAMGPVSSPYRVSCCRCSGRWQGLVAETQRRIRKWSVKGLDGRVPSAAHLSSSSSDLVSVRVASSTSACGTWAFSTSKRRSSSRCADRV